MPRLRDGYVLVKVLAVGVNPTDWKHIDFGLTKPVPELGAITPEWSSRSVRVSSRLLERAIACAERCMERRSYFRAGPWSHC